MMALQERLGRNKTILANFSYLSLLQVFAILFPLLTYPYLLRVIGLELYGVIIFAQSYNKLCIAGDQLRVQYVRSEERGEFTSRIGQDYPGSSHPFIGVSSFYGLFA